MVEMFILKTITQLSRDFSQGLWCTGSRLDFVFLWLHTEAVINISMYHLSVSSVRVLVSWYVSQTSQACIKISHARLVFHVDHNRRESKDCGHHWYDGQRWCEHVHSDGGEGRDVDWAVRTHAHGETPVRVDIKCCFHLVELWNVIYFWG